jgi:hypothetical protein
LEPDEESGEREGGDGEAQGSHGSGVFRLEMAVGLRIGVSRPGGAKEGRRPDSEVKSW